MMASKAAPHTDESKKVIAKTTFTPVFQAKKKDDTSGSKVSNHGVSVHDETDSIDLPVYARERKSLRAKSIASLKE